MGGKTTQRSEPQEHGMGITGTQILGLRFRVQSLGFRVLDPNSLKHKKGEPYCCWKTTRCQVPRSCHTLKPEALQC